MRRHMVKSVLDHLVDDIGFIDRDTAKSMGDGKVLRKYASTLLRALNPVPACASARALHDRHQHSAEQQREAYATDHCERPLTKWARLPARTRARAVFEDLTLL